MYKKESQKNIWTFFKKWHLIISSIICYLSFYFNQKERINENCYLFLWVGIMLFAIIIIDYLCNKPKKKCMSLYSPGNGNTPIKIIIERGDVLKQKGKKVIHVQDTFETNIDKCLKDSLWRAFLSQKKIKKNKADLETKIKNSLANVSAIGKNERVSNDMKKERYDIGTVVKYLDYQMVAFSTIQDTEGNVDEKSITQLEGDIDKVFAGLKNVSNATVRNKTYNVGVLGFINNGTLLDTRKRIEIMVNSFIKSNKEKPWCMTFRICLLKKHVKETKFDFYEMQGLLDYFVDTRV